VKEVATLGRRCGLILSSSPTISIAKRDPAPNWFCSNGVPDQIHQDGVDVCL